jgi:ESAT-6 family protein
MGGNLSTNYQHMASVAKDVENVEQEIQATVTKLTSDLAPLEASWKGQAATAFHQLKERFLEDADKLNQALSRIAEQLKTASGTYSAQEDEANRSVSSLQSRLNG